MRWLKNLLQRKPQGLKRQQTGVARKRSFKPQLEYLESRELPAGYALASVIDNNSNTPTHFAMIGPNVYERHGSAGWQPIASQIVDDYLSAGTDATGQPVVFFSSESTYGGDDWTPFNVQPVTYKDVYEWHDSTQSATEILSKVDLDLDFCIAGRNGYFLGENVENHSVYLLHEATPGGQLSWQFLNSNVQGASIGTDENGNVMVDILKNGVATEWTKAKGSVVLSKDVIDVSAGQGGVSYLVMRDHSLQLYSEQDNSMLQIADSGIEGVEAGTASNGAPACTVRYNNGENVLDPYSFCAWDADQGWQVLPDATLGNLVGGLIDYYGPSPDLDQFNISNGKETLIGIDDGINYTITTPVSVLQGLNIDGTPISSDIPPSTSVSDGGELGGNPNPSLAHVSGRQLIINGGPAGSNDTITVRADQALPGNLQVLESGSDISGGLYVMSFPIAWFDSIWIDAGAGYNTIDLNYVPSNVATHVTAHGTDSITAGALGYNLSNFAGGLYVTGNGNTTLILDDEGTGEGYIARPHPTFTVNDGLVSYLDKVDMLSPTTGQVQQTLSYPATFDYSGLATLVLNGGNAGNEFDVRSLAAVTDLDINTGRGSNTTQIGGDGTKNYGFTSVNGNLVETNTLDTVQGTVTVHGEGTDTLLVNDQAATGYKYGTTFSYQPSIQYTVTNGEVSRTNSLGISQSTGTANSASLTEIQSEILYDGIADLEIHGGSNGNEFDVRSTVAATPVTIYTGAGTNKTVVGGDGTINYSYLADAFLHQTNNLDAIQGKVAVHGQGQDSIVLNDQATAAYYYGTLFSYVPSVQFNIGAGTITRSNAISTVFALGTTKGNSLNLVQSTIAYDGSIRSVTVNGSTTDKNTFLVQSVEIGSPVTLNGGNAADTFTLGDDDFNLEYFSGTLTLNGGGGNDTVTVNDAADVENALGPKISYYLSNQSRQPNGQVLNRFDSFDPDLPGADIEYGGIEQLTLNASPYGNDINIDSTRAATPVTVYTGTGTNTINLGLAAGRISPLAGLVKVHGQGKDTLLISDNATIPGQHYVVAANFVGWASVSNTIVPIHVQYDGLTRLELDGAERGNVIAVGGTAAGTATIVKAGLGNDTVKISGTAAGFAGTLSIDGQGSVNTLDYTGFRGPVAVNLPLHTATAAAGGIANIRNVTGGSGDDMFVGDGTGNVLKGGTGRNFLIAGAAPGTLIGQGGEDVLIGGSTSYDTSPTALSALMAEWTANLPYQSRVLNVLNGGQGGAPALNGTTGFTNNGGGNTLTGADGYDLFYGIKAKDTNDWNAAQQEVFIENSTPVNLRVDAHFLTVKWIYLDNTVLNTSTPTTLSLLPGVHTLVDFYGNNYGAVPIKFTLHPDGTVSYDSYLTGVLSSPGPGTLLVNGVTATIDAHTLYTSMLTVDYTDFGRTASPFTITVLPGPQEFFDTYDSGGTYFFSVAANGTANGIVSYPDSERKLLSGQGTSTLTVSGVAITIDARSLSTPLLTIDTAYARPTNSLIPLNVLPGPQWVWDYYGSGETLRFAVSDTGAITFDSGFSGVLSAQGSTLTITGKKVTIDPRQLYLAALIVDTTIREPMTEEFPLNLLPGDHWLTDNYGWSNPVHFQVNPDGTVSYASSLAGVFTGNGTAASPLVLEGVTIQIDATAIDSRVPYFSVASLGGLSTVQVQTLHVLPGTFQFTAGSEQLQFSVTEQPDGSYGLSYDSTLDGKLTGRGTRRLTLLT